MVATSPTFAYPPELIEALRVASEEAPKGPWRGRERPGDRPAVLDAEGYVLAKLSDDQEGEEIGSLITASVNFARAFLAHMAAQGTKA